MQEAQQKLTVELMRHGATLLKEPCPKCGGIMLRYKGVDVCPADSGMTSLAELEERARPPPDISEEVGDVARAKLKELLGLVGEEREPVRLHAILEDVSLLIGILAKAKDLRG
ncbi:MAG: hypothetical protein JRN39_01690 [Nitrososphaerota archaeon]|nr:hypothetical protein [Nitrososphaerota archaeon]MDG6939098.1 hypothetical protein [Nitrososphaerota archaeon]